MCQPTASSQADGTFWRHGADVKDVKGTNEPIYKPDVYELINKKISELDKELRELSLDIHGASDCISLSHATDDTDLLSSSADHPELKFEEQCV